MKYILTRDRLGLKAGETVYDYNGCTYCCVSDDERETGVAHRAVTRDPNGGTPFITVPAAWLTKDPQPQEHTS